MKTVGIDTNVLLTYRLARGKDFKIVKVLFGQCLDNKLRLYIPTPVILETEWVLRSVYKQSKEQIINFLQELFLIDNLLLDYKEDIKFSLNLYKQSSGVNFTDCVIVRQIQDKNYEFLTFDKNLEKLYQTI